MSSEKPIDMFVRVMSDKYCCSVGQAYIDTVNLVIAKAKQEAYDELYNFFVVNGTDALIKKLENLKEANKMEVVIKYQKQEKKRAENLRSDIKQANRDFWNIRKLKVNLMPL